MLITVHPSGKQFECAEGDTILDGALRADVWLPHACKDGACGACKGKIVVGAVSLDDHHPDVLGQGEKDGGYTLFCRARPAGDVELEVAELNELRGIQIKTMPARVESVKKPSSDVAILTLRLPKSESFVFLPGQYIDLLLNGGAKRSYSIASSCATDNLIELHVRRVPGGFFSSHVHENMKEKDVLRFRGPLGSFFIRDNSSRPIIMVATGTGIAPIKSMLGAALKKGTVRPIRVYWGCRTRADMYHLHEMQSLAQDVDWLEFVPVLSRPLPEEAWQGEVGRVQDVLLRDFKSFEGHEVYACGAPAMVSDVKNILCSRGLLERSFHADPFYPSCV